MQYHLVVPYLILVEILVKSQTGTIQQRPMFASSFLMKKIPVIHEKVNLPGFNGRGFYAESLMSLSSSSVLRMSSIVPVWNQRPWCGRQKRRFCSMARSQSTLTENLPSGASRSTRG